MMKSILFWVLFFSIVFVIYHPVCAQVVSNSGKAEEDAIAEIDESAYSKMLEESFLVEMNPGTKMAQPIESTENQPTISKGSLIADESGDYEEIFGRGESLVREKTLIDIPGFPKYIDTGDPELDIAAYQTIAQKWANEHPTESRKIAGFGIDFQQGEKNNITY